MPPYNGSTDTLLRKGIANSAAAQALLQANLNYLHPL